MFARSRRWLETHAQSFALCWTFERYDWVSSTTYGTCDWFVVARPSRVVSVRGVVGKIVKYGVTTFTVVHPTIDHEQRSEWVLQMLYANTLRATCMASLWCHRWRRWRLVLFLRIPKVSSGQCATCIAWTWKIHMPAAINLQPVWWHRQLVSGVMRQRHKNSWIILVGRSQFENVLMSLLPQYFTLLLRRVINFKFPP